MLYSLFCVYVQSSLGMNSIAELIAYAKTHPAPNYGSSGIGSVHHLCMAQVGNRGGWGGSTSPTRGVAQSIPALAGGGISLMCSPPLPAGPLLRAGKVRVPAVASARRSPLQPEVPSLAEAGLPGIEAGASTGVLMPAGVPREVVRRMSGEITAAVRSPEVSARLTGPGQEIVARDPDQYAELIRDELKRYAVIVKASGARAE